MDLRTNQLTQVIGVIAILAILFALILGMLSKPTSSRSNGDPYITAWIERCSQTPYRCSGDFYKYKGHGWMPMGGPSTVPQWPIMNARQDSSLIEDVVELSPSTDPRKYVEVARAVYGK